MLSESAVMTLKRRGVYSCYLSSITIKAILTTTCNAVCLFRQVETVTEQVNCVAGRCIAGEYTTHCDAQLVMKLRPFVWYRTALNDLLCSNSAFSEMLQYVKRRLVYVGPPDICRCHVQTLAQACTPISVPYLQHAALEAHPHIALAVHLHAGHSWHQTALEALQLTGGGCCQVMCKKFAGG